MGRAMLRQRWHKLITLSRALLSIFRYGDAPLKTYRRRQDACGPCEQYKTTLTGLFCGACGCPRSPVSDLRTKWRLLDLECPLGKWET